MAVFNGSAQRVQVGPGTLYAAPLGTTEPTALTGAWPAGWVALGYTDKGNDRSHKPTVNGVEVDEEYYAIRQQVEMYDDSVSFSLAELTVVNRILALNGGIGTSSLSDITGTNPDTSVWVEPPDPGEEVQVMLGWDFIPKGGTTGPVLGRSIYRQCLQSGEIKETMQKGASNKRLLTVTFTLSRPATGLRPYRDILPASIAS